MKWLLNQWWFKWFDQWWLRVPTHVIGVVWLLGFFLPNSGLNELSLKLIYILGYVTILTAVVQGVMWLWPRRHA